MEATKTDLTPVEYRVNFTTIDQSTAIDPFVQKSNNVKGQLDL